MTPTPAPAVRYVALGDSFTIGTSVTAPERWPNQLVARLPRLDLVANLGVNGYTSQDLIDVELPQLDDLRPEFLTVLIGVNDVVQGVPEDTYAGTSRRSSTTSCGRVGASRILVVTTPDYTVTPAGADYGDPARQAAAIRADNATITELATTRGITVVDIHDLSLRAATDRSLVAGDGLHPSGAVPRLWVDRLTPVISALVARSSGYSERGDHLSREEVERRWSQKYRVTWGTPRSIEGGAVRSRRPALDPSPSRARREGARWILGRIGEAGARSGGKSADRGEIHLSRSQQGDGPEVPPDLGAVRDEKVVRDPKPLNRAVRVPMSAFSAATRA